MKRIFFLIAVFLLLIFYNCDEDSIEPEQEPVFDLSVITGTHIGVISHYNSTMVYGEKIPSGSFRVARDCEFKITKLGGSDYKLSVDTSKILFTPPNIHFTIRILPVNWAVQLLYLENDSNYCSYQYHDMRYSRGVFIPPSNYFSYKEKADKVEISLTIQKTKPDSIHFIKFAKWR